MAKNIKKLCCRIITELFCLWHWLGDLNDFNLWSRLDELKLTLRLSYSRTGVREILEIFRPQHKYCSIYFFMRIIWGEFFIYAIRIQWKFKTWFQMTSKMKCVTFSHIWKMWKFSCKRIGAWKISEKPPSDHKMQSDSRKRYKIVKFTVYKSFQPTWNQETSREKVLVIRKLKNRRIFCLTIVEKSKVE